MANERAIAALHRYDLTCENFTRGDCFRAGRRVDATQTGDLACWPCRIRAALATRRCVRNHSRWSRDSKRCLDCQRDRMRRARA